MTSKDIKVSPSGEADPAEQDEVGIIDLVLQLIQDLQDIASIDDPDILRMFDPAL